MAVVARVRSNALTMVRPVGLCNVAGQGQTGHTKGDYTECWENVRDVLGEEATSLRRIESPDGNGSGVSMQSQRPPAGGACPEHASM